MAVRLMIAGGKTGGHLFPGIAIAEEFLARNSGNEVLFVGTRDGIEARVIPALGHQLKFIRSAGLVRVGFLGRLKGLIKLPLGILDALRIASGFKPHVALGVGGFSSGPALLAAFLRGTKIAIHEQNYVPGLANKLLARLSAKIFVAFKTESGPFPESKTVFSGNPVRASLKPGRIKTEGKPTLFVFGGSQGAHAINMEITRIFKEDDELRKRIKVIHQTGKADFNEVRDAYAGLDMEAEVHPFIDDMGLAYSRADLVVSRSGASTIFELAMVEKPSVLVPYPHAVHDHQKLNALAFEQGGAAILVGQEQFAAGALKDAIKNTLFDGEKLNKMSEAVKAFKKPDAAKVIVDEIIKLAA